jgi:4-hydroxybenzoate polyprenyltransferase
LLISVVFAIPFLGNTIFLILWAAWILMTTAYSVKPIRLKERGSIGLVDVVLAQRVMPILLVFAAFGYSKTGDVLLITIYILFRGLASDINHQIEDYQQDWKTATRTFAVSKGYGRTRKIFYFVLECEKLLLLFILIVMLIRLHDQSGMTIHPFLTLPFVYIAAYLYSIYRIIRGRWENPFGTREKSIFQFIHHPFPSVILPLFLLCNLMVYNLVYGLLLILFLQNKRLLNKETIVNSYPYTLLKKISSSH